MNNPTHWLDVMPALPLALGVPVKLARGEFPALAEAIGYVNARRLRRGALVRRVSSSGDVLLTEETKGWESAEAWRVDLDDPQGVAWALQFLAQHHGRSMGDDYADVIMRHLWGNTTDEDRLVVAQALKEVNR